MSSIQSHLKAHSAFYVGIGFVVFYLLGNFLPELFWATHDSFFSSGILQFLTWVIVIICLGLSYFTPKQTFNLSRLPVNGLSSHLGIGLIAVIGGILFYSFPIANDFYGDARIFRSFVHEPVSQFPENFWEQLFSFSLEPHHGRTGVRLMLTGIAYWAGSSTYEVFRWMGVTCGMGFILVWLYAIQHFIQHDSWRMILSIAGLTSPMLLIFFGHVENYSLVYLLLLSWLLLLLYQVQNRSKRLYIVLLLLLLIFARFHIMLLLCLPGLLLAGLHTFASPNSSSLRLLTVKGMLLGLLIPLLIIGLIGYFFVFEDHRDPRVMEDFKDIERLFLPLFSPQAPFDRYNLLSFNHLVDFFNSILLWSPACLFLVTWIGIKNPIIKWGKDPIVSILSLSFLLFLAMFFMINPLFSMPMEWDLMCFPATIFMVLTVYWVSKIQATPAPRSVLLIIGALAMFTFSTIYVNSHIKPLSRKIETIGRHVYKTYYAHSSTYLLFALNLDNEGYAERKASILKDLEPFALQGKDKLYAELLMDEAMMYFSVQNVGGAKMMIAESLGYYPPLAETYQEFIKAVQKSRP